MPAKLELKNITKHVHANTGATILILENINLSIELSSAKIYSILAPMDSGKSTLLKIISGIEKADSGEILVDGSKPEKFFPYIPEKPSSLPWLSVMENITHVPNIKRKPEEVIAAVGLTGYEDYIPDEKSIGFRFRISLARALALNPSLILIDDSFRDTGVETRQELAEMIKSIASKFQVSILFASSGITDSLMISDEVFLMQNNPGHIYHHYKCSGNPVTDFSSVKEALEKEHLIHSNNFSI